MAPQRLFGQSYTPLSCTAEAQERFTSTTFAIGVRLEADDRPHVEAAFGLEDQFGLRLRPNPRQVQRTVAATPLPLARTRDRVKAKGLVVGATALRPQPAANAGALFAAVAQLVGLTKGQVSRYGCAVGGLMFYGFQRGRRARG
jgi:Nucleotidyltransferase